MVANETKDKYDWLSEYNRVTRKKENRYCHYNGNKSMKFVKTMPLTQDIFVTEVKENVFGRPTCTLWSIKRFLVGGLMGN